MKDKGIIAWKPGACVIDKEPSIAAKKRHALSPERNEGRGSQFASEAVEKTLMGLKLDLKPLPQDHCES